MKAMDPLALKSDAAALWALAQPGCLAPRVSARPVTTKEDR